MARYYLLNEDHSVSPVEDALKWGEAFEGQRKAHIVAQEDVGKRWVSTVFLGIDHAFGGGSPLLFETMVFEGGHGGHCERYSTWDEAVEGHKRMCANLTSGLSREELEQSKVIIEALLTKG